MGIIFSTQPIEFETKPVQQVEKPKNETVTEIKQKPTEITSSKQEFAKEEFDTESRQAILKETLAEHDISLKITKDEETGQLVVALIDDKTGEAVQQFPSEASLKLSEIFTKIQGQFIEKRA